MNLSMHFFFNLSLLIVLLFFGLLWIERTNNLRSIRITALIYFIVSLFICFVFTYRLYESMLVDLRNIPFIIGGLYMGLGPLLGILTIIIRGFYGFNFGFLFTLIFCGGLTLLLWRLSPHFIKCSSRRRILLSVGLTFLFGFFQASVIGLVYKTYPIFDVWFAYLFIQPIGVAMIAYLIEIVDKNILLRQHMIKTKRLEAVEQMAAAVSHEIRNPLTAAIGFVQLMRDDSIKMDKQVQYLSIVKSELKSAERIIQNYLTYSQSQIETLEPLSIHQNLQEIIHVLQPLANKHLVKINTSFSHVSMIEVDRQKFHQCMINIMKNSIESMPNGGTLTVETESTPINVIIRIHDTGIGMSREQLDHLGEPYYSTKGIKGTGLGLMVAYSIIEAMKGSIQVDSEVGKGTIFEVSLKQSKVIQ